MDARDADRGDRREAGRTAPRLRSRTAAAWPMRRDDRAQRQSDLLDEALKQTFPASDPVSVALVE
jgi:hypothetical protein